MQMTKRTKAGPYEYKLVHQEHPSAPTQPSTTASADDSSPTASTDPDQTQSAASLDPLPSALAASDVPPNTPARSNPSHLPDLERHARKCCICSHPDRDAIEGEFIRWDCPRRIAKDYQIADRASFYRHAHATGLYARRRREFARVLENILECVEHSTLEETADVIIRASRVYARLDENGNWVEPRRTHVILTGPAPPQFAGNQELADSFELQPRLAHQEISLTHPKRRDRTSKRKRDLIATPDPARLLRPGHGGQMTLGIPSESTAAKEARRLRSGRARGPRQLSSKRVKKSTHKSKAKKRLIATPPKLENGPTP